MHAPERLPNCLPHLAPSTAPLTPASDPIASADRPLHQGYLAVEKAGKPDERKPKDRNEYLHRTERQQTSPSIDINAVSIPRLHYITDPHAITWIEYGEDSASKSSV
jgi:hypothetical protein